jgi:myo-inositol-1(or 4)-monophosphatase
MRGMHAATQGGEMGISGSENMEDLIDFAMDVVHRAGDMALGHYGKGSPDLKFDEGLVTEAELQLSEFFEDQIRKHFPEHRVFTNNDNEKDYSHDKRRYLWIHDPLDGVANFQAGIPIWGTSLALLENFWPIFGAFYMPSTGDVFHARAGKKAFRGEEAIRTSTQENINDESLLLTYSRFHNRFRSTFPGKIRDLGCTGAHICYVAMGRAEAAILSNESYQDLAAVRVIIDAAGGKIFKMDGSEFFLNEYLDGDRIHDHLLVVNADAYTEVRGFLQGV